MWLRNDGRGDHLMWRFSPTPSRGQLHDGIYVSFKTGESEDAVVDRALFKLVDASHIALYRNGPVPQSAPLEPSTLHLSQRFDFDGHTLTLSGVVTGTLSPNGDIVWSHGYTSRYKGPLTPSLPEEHRTREEGEVEEPRGLTLEQLVEEPRGLTLEQLVLVLIGNSRLCPRARKKEPSLSRKFEKESDC